MIEVRSDPRRGLAALGTGSWHAYRSELAWPWAGWGTPFRAVALGAAGLASLAMLLGWRAISR